MDPTNPIFGRLQKNLMMTTTYLMIIALMISNVYDNLTPKFMGLFFMPTIFRLISPTYQPYSIP